jgi:hypothetical protein
LDGDGLFGNFEVIPVRSRGIHESSNGSAIEDFEVSNRPRLGSRSRSKLKSKSKSFSESCTAVAVGAGGGKGGLSMTRLFVSSPDGIESTPF